MLRMIPLFAIAIMLLPQAQSAPQGRGRGHHKDEAPKFEREHRQAIGSYYRSSRRDLPPGLAKRDRLPPGLEKQLRRNGALPPGLERHFTPFPVEIERRLPPCPPDVRRGLVGGVAVMYSARSGLILDAFVVGR